MLPPDALHQSEFACENCDVLFSVGTSGEVYPAAGLPLMAKRYGAVIVEVNPNPTSISYQMDYILQGTSSQILPELVNQIKIAKGNS
jgi:NAD-dependent deacetylase